MTFINELDQGTAGITDEEFVMLKRIMVERRGHDAAHVTVAPADTVNDEGRMDPERGQLEQSSAGTSRLEQSSAGTSQLKQPSSGTGFETPGQQCLPNREIGRTIADDCLIVGVRSNLRGNSFPLEELVTGVP